jgi:hypothetical protein
MKKLFYLLVGVVLGFAAAHVVSRNPSGKKFFDNVDGKIREFGAAIVDGYRGREAELRGARRRIRHGVRARRSQQARLDFHTFTNHRRATRPRAPRPPFIGFSSRSITRTIGNSCRPQTSKAAG